MKHIGSAIMTILATTVITGVIYPVLMTGLAQAVFPYQANGSLIEKHGKAIGSALIGQNFTSDKYFHPRPSVSRDGAGPEGSDEERPGALRRGQLGRLQPRKRWWTG
jgi:K+-transporting ATPase ATPase C chain